MSSSHQQKVVLIASIVKSVLWRSIDKYTEGYIEKIWVVTRYWKEVTKD